MKNEKEHRKDEFLVSYQPFKMPSLFFQPVLLVDGERRYLRSFNILSANTVIKKIYLNKPLVLNEKLSLAEMIMEILVKECFGSEGQKTVFNGDTNKKATKPNRPKPDQAARGKAASDLFSTLGL